MNETVLNEILRQFIDTGQNPSAAAIAALAQATNKTATIIKEHYKALYREASGNDDDPFGPVMPVVG